MLSICSEIHHIKVSGAKEIWIAGLDFTHNPFDAYLRSILYKILNKVMSIMWQVSIHAYKFTSPFSH